MTGDDDTGQRLDTQINWMEQRVHNSKKKKKKQGKSKHKRRSFQ